MDLKRTAREVLENVGGEENIISIIKLFNENVFGEEVLGKKDRENGEQLIL